MDKLFELQPKRIAIFRALQLGDMLCAIPAIRAIKKAFPFSEITLIGLPWAASFVKRFSKYFDQFIHFPGYPGLPEQEFNPLSFIDFLKEVNNRHFDLVIQMHGNGSLINPMIQMMGAKHTAGFCEIEGFGRDSNLYMPYPENENEIRRHLLLTEFLGIQSEGPHLEFIFNEEDENSYQNLLQNFNLKPKQYCCVHSGARDTKRWWGAARFAEIADFIANCGYTIVLTGTEIEAETVNMVEKSMTNPCINLVGKTDLGTLAQLIKNSKMLFSNDTGVSHISSSLEVSSLIIFLASDPVRWAPLNKKLHNIVLPSEATNIDLIKSKVEGILQYEEVEA